MKKAITIIITFAMLFCSAALADGSDPAALSFAAIQDELDTFNLKIWQTGNWSSVIVPDGSYIVGKDLPAGRFTVRSATYKMSTWLEMIPAGSGEDYYKDARYRDMTLSSTDDTELELTDGDRVVISLAGTKFINPDYMPRFTPDPAQDDAVRALRSEYDLLLAELKSRPEWIEVPVPEGMYQVGVKIPASHWTIWPKGTRAGVHYGQELNSKGEIFYSEVNASLKDSSLSSFEFGFHEGWVSIDAQDGWYIKIDSGDVIFTPYIGTTPFLFNE